MFIKDPFLEVNDTYEPYLLGKASDILVKWPSVDVMPNEDYDDTGSTAMMGFVSFHVVSYIVY